MFLKHPAFSPAHRIHLSSYPTTLSYHRLCTLPPALLSWHSRFFVFFIIPFPSIFYSKFLRKWLKKLPTAGTPRPTSLCSLPSWKSSSPTRSRSLPSRTGCSRWATLLPLMPSSTWPFPSLSIFYTFALLVFFYSTHILRSKTFTDLLILLQPARSEAAKEPRHFGPRRCQRHTQGNSSQEWSCRRLQHVHPARPQAGPQEAQGRR